MAQVPAPEPARQSNATKWLPGISIGAGVATVGTERIPWDRQPFVGSIRIELSRLFVVEAEWTETMHAHTFHDTGDVGLATLNGQSGIYGRDTSSYDYGLGMTSIALLARSRMSRLSFLGGAGLGRFTHTQEGTFTRTGCTGPWVVACEGGNRTFTGNQTGTALIVVGGVDVDVLPRVQAFVSGRIGGSNAIEEAAVAAGVRMTLLPDSSRRGRPAKSAVSTARVPGVRSGDHVWIVHEDGKEESGTFLGASAWDVTIRTATTIVTTPFAAIRTIAKPDSLLEGVGFGMAVGLGAGLAMAYFDERRTIPAAVLIGGGVGALIDALHARRRVVYRKSTSVTVSPVLTPSVAKVGVNVAWR
jgi:hypothetical protein